MVIRRIRLGILTTPGLYGDLVPFDTPKLAWPRRCIDALTELLNAFG